MEHTLYSSEGIPIVFPFAFVEYDLLLHLPQPPHTEDYRYNPAHVRFIERMEDKARREFLNKTMFENVSSIFQQPILKEPGYYVLDGQGPRSLGTIRPKRVIRAIYEQSSEGTPKYRLGFVDYEEAVYWLTVTDLCWRYHADDQLRQGDTFDNISARQTTILRKSDVYLRIGLARSWEKFPDRSYLQITGIFSFPDYLDGRTYADFAPE